MPDVTWTERVCGDGAVLLRDGEPVPIEDIVAELNRVADLEAAIAKALRHADKNGMGGWSVFTKMRKVLKR